MLIDAWNHHRSNVEKTAVAVADFIEIYFEKFL